MATKEEQAAQQTAAESMFSMGQAGTKAGIDQYVQNTEYVKNIQDSSNKMIESIGGEITSIKDTAKKSMTDVNALTGELRSSFESTRNDVLNMVQASSRKSALEMDTYLGSAGSDARSAVRRNMISSMTTGLVSQAQQGISALYKDYSKSVVDTTLKGMETNNQTINVAYDAISKLTDQSSKLLLGTASTVMSGYSDALKASLGLMSAKNDLAKLDLEKEQLAFNENLAIEKANRDAYDSNWQSKPFESIFNNPKQLAATRKRVLGDG